MELRRKIEVSIKEHFATSDKILVIDGARQIGKTYIIRKVCAELFENVVEINMLEDSLQARQFANARSVEDFCLQLSLRAGEKMKDRHSTIVFIDEIQAYPHLLTLLKFLRQDGRFTYIASGSLLGVTLSQTTSIPMGSIFVKRMYALDLEEFMWANGVGSYAIDVIRSKFNGEESLDEATHNKMMDLLRKYLLTGGLPEAVKAFVERSNLHEVRQVQEETHDYYAIDAAKYDTENRLKIRRIYDLIPSNLENKKKRVVVRDIEGKSGQRFSNYENEFDYLVSSGIALEVKAISKPAFPLIESCGKNLLKLYLNDVGILTSILYRTNAQAVLNDEASVNLGTLYEAFVASELKAHGYQLFYYDNKQKGEVDFLIDDYASLSVVPLEVKSGKDYTIHSALNNFMSTAEYGIKKAYVLSNNRIIKRKGNIIYVPVYNIMFFDNV